MGELEGTVVADGKRPLQPEDLLRLVVISDAQLSPNGRHVAYAVQRAHLDRNDYSSALWLVATDGNSEPRQLTLGEHHQDTSPRWSPDGSRLAFVSDRSGKPQLYLVERADSGWSGEPRRITELERGVAGPVWSPDGRRLAFTSSEGNGLPDAERNRPGGIIRHVRRRRYRFDVLGYIDDRFSHVWVVEAAGGAPIRVTRGEQDALAPAWSPDGRQIAFVANRLGEETAFHRSQLYVVDLPDAGTTPTDGDADGARRLETGTRTAAAPAWSPDGATIAVLGVREGSLAGANNGVWAVPVAGGPTRQLTAGFDRSAGVGTYSDTWSTATAPPTLFWTPSGDAVLFTACDQGRVSLFRAPSGSGRVETVVGGDRTLALVTGASDGQTLAYAAGSFTNPCDLYACGADGANERRLTRLNEAILSELAIQTPELIRFPSAPQAGAPGSFEVDAWLIRPVGYEAGRQYPLVQHIHGGPHSVFGHTFFFDNQLWASAGYNVLFVNPRASQGYGEAFANANLGRWGIGDLPEQTQALDLVVERGGVDPNRLAVTGLSYGGFMTNWTVGQTDRYRAAVSENGISNLISMYGTSDISWAWLEHEIGQDIWANLDHYLRLSPITYTPKVRTPILFLQAETDYRCPIEQGEQFYTALLARGGPTEMVRFPGESHAFLSAGKPESRLQRRQHTLRWWRTFL